jgi:hypothetical protein
VTATTVFPVVHLVCAQNFTSLSLPGTELYSLKQVALLLIHPVQVAAKVVSRTNFKFPSEPATSLSMNVLAQHVYMLETQKFQRFGQFYLICDHK